MTDSYQDPVEGEERSSRIPAHLPVPNDFSKPPRRLIEMTPLLSGLGSLLVFFSVVLMVVVLPSTTYEPPPSDNWLPISDAAMRGRSVYLANGCVYCHSGFSRPQDYFNGQYYLYRRISEPGDYWLGARSPNILGTERTGPDLSQEGGNHPDTWHLAHYWSPRSTMPKSIMPRFSFFSEEDLADMIAFNQSQGGKEAVLRYAAVTVGNQLMQINQAQEHPRPEEIWPELVAELREEGTFVENGKPSDSSPWGLPWMAVWMINSFDRGYWLTDNPLPLTEQNILDGKREFLERCVGCHGENGTGDGPAAQFFEVKPFNFADETAMVGPMSSPGMMYHRMLTAGPGTAMENFGQRLSVDDMWRIVLFLRTIPNGGLRDLVPTVEMYLPWEPPQGLLNYIEDHPIEVLSPGPGQFAELQPFYNAAQWVAPGLAQGDEVLVGGVLPMNLDRLADLIRQRYFNLVEAAYNDALARDEQLPPRELIFSIEGVEFHQP